MSIEFTPHLDENVLDQYLLERLVDPALALVEEHLMVCAACRRRLEESEAFIRAFRAATARMPPQT